MLASLESHGTTLPDGYPGLHGVTAGLLSSRQHQFRLAAVTATSSLNCVIGAARRSERMADKADACLLLWQLIRYWNDGVLAVCWLYLRTNPDLDAVNAKTGPLGFNRFAMLVLFLQIVFGGLVSANQAGSACQGFPACNGQWWPKADYHNALNFFYGLYSGYTGVISFDAQVAAGWLHRIGALVCFVVLTLLNVKRNFGKLSQAG